MHGALDTYILLKSDLDTVVGSSSAARRAVLYSMITFVNGIGSRNHSYVFHPVHHAMRIEHASDL